MNILRLGFENGALTEHYQYGMLKLLPVPVNYGVDCADKEFFAYISSLGGGLLEGDKYTQSFKLINSKAVISSQSSQKIYKGNSKIETKIDLDDKSSFVFHNDANVFYPNAHFTNKTKIFIKRNSRLFYVDGGFIGYAKGNFAADMSLRLYIDYKLALNDVFYYRNTNNLNALYNHEYFYSVVISGGCDVEHIHEEHLKSHSSTIDGVTILRVLADNNGEAIKYINSIKGKWLQDSKMTLMSIR